MTASQILLDTHIALWAITDDHKLPGAAKDAMLVSENQFYYSAASVWEIAIKHASHPGHLTFSGSEFARFCRLAGFSPLPVTEEHVRALEGLLLSGALETNKDPFDRILIAQAKAEGFLFLTHDSRIPFYDENFVWRV